MMMLMMTVTGRKQTNKRFSFSPDNSTCGFQLLSYHGSTCKVVSSFTLFINSAHIQRASKWNTHSGTKDCQSNGFVIQLIRQIPNECAKRYHILILHLFADNLQDQRGNRYAVLSRFHNESWALISNGTRRSSLQRKETIFRCLILVKLVLFQLARGFLSWVRVSLCDYQTSYKCHV